MRSEIESVVAKMKSPLLYARWENIHPQLKAEIVLDCCYKGISRSREAVERNMAKSEIDNIIYEFKTIGRITQKIRKSINMMRPKLNKRHIKWLQKFTEESSGKRYIMTDARQHLLSKFQDLTDVSTATLSTLFHRRFNLSYKKLGIANPISVTPEHRINRIDWYKLITGLMDKGFYLVFTDEFLVNRNTLHSYGWTKRGTIDRLVENKLEFKISFAVAHSRGRMEDIMGTQTTFNQLKYLRYLKTLIKRIMSDINVDPNRLIIVADNWRFHKTGLIRKFFETRKLTWIFIPTYSPELNPWEKLINYIKQYIKSQMSMKK